MALVDNQRARFDYDLLERFEAGLKLQGPEVKALRAGQASLLGARVLVRGGAAYLVGATIAPYQPNNLTSQAEPGRNIELLVTKKELSVLAAAETQAGLTVIPLSVYNKGRHLKLGLAIARGKKKYDKRQAIKRRETEREMRRTLTSK